MKKSITFIVLMFVGLVAIRGEEAKPFVPLFDGQTLDGWKRVGGRKDQWVVDNNCIVCMAHDGGWLSTAKQYSDFTLRLEYRLQPGGNSGIFLRAPRFGRSWRRGMEIQLLDDGHPNYKNIQPYQYTGSIYHLVPPSKHVAKSAGQWNHIEIEARGPNIRVTLNKEQIVNADLNSLKEVADKYPGILRKKGFIGLQSHGGRLEFRNIHIQEH